MSAVNVQVSPAFNSTDITRERTSLTFELRESTSTSTSTLFHKTIGYNRLARKIAIANLGGPVKRKINWKEKKGKEKEGKTTILSYNE